jgi:hypothetical protein
MSFEIERLEKRFGRANQIAEAFFVKLQSMMYAAIGHALPLVGKSFRTKA